MLHSVCPLGRNPGIIANAGDRRFFDEMRPNKGWIRLHSGVPTIAVTCVRPPPHLPPVPPPLPPTCCGLTFLLLLLIVSFAISNLDLSPALAAETDARCGRGSVR